MGANLKIEDGALGGEEADEERSSLRIGSPTLIEDGTTYCGTFSGCKM